jgi:hypothetical protein
MLGVAALGVLAEDAVAAAQVVVAAQARRAGAAGQAGLDDDLGAHRHVGDAGADRVDRADDVRAEAVRVLEVERRPAAPHPQVEVVERDRRDRDPDLARAEARRGSSAASSTSGPPCRRNTCARIVDIGATIHARVAECASSASRVSPITSPTS